MLLSLDVIQSREEQVKEAAQGNLVKIGWVYRVKMESSKVLEVEGPWVIKGIVWNKG